MSAAKHTPGPWRFNEENGVVTDQEEGRSVAYIAGRSRAFGHERLTSACFNGHLIASAPELLEAAKTAVQELCGLAAYLETCDHSVLLDNLQSLVAGIRHKQQFIEVAIRKARGEK